MENDKYVIEAEAHAKGFEDFKKAHAEVRRYETRVGEGYTTDALTQAVQKRCAASIRFLAENARHADADHETTKAILEWAAQECEREIVKEFGSGDL
jgi:ribonuclease HII